MPGSESAAEGRLLLRDRIREAADGVARVPMRFDRLATAPPALPRTLVTTGIGTSEGHARHLADVAVRYCGQPARFAATGSLAKGAPPDAKHDWLVVFSQGLSANARHALTEVEAWGGVLLVTGLSLDADRHASEKVEPLSEDKRSWLEGLEARGVIRIDLGCGAEYGALIRVMGARAGYAVAWSLLRSLSRRRLSDPGPLGVPQDFSDTTLRAAQEGARAKVEKLFPPDEPMAPFFDAARTLVLVGQDGTLEQVEQLTLKVAEGMLRPQPRSIDVLQFAHGPLQSLALRSTSLLYLTTENGEGDSDLWLDRLRSTLDPELHDLRVVRANLPWPFAAIEFEAIFDEIVVRMLDETDSDLVDWPGAEREAELYGAGPRPLEASATDRSSLASVPRYEESVWPEMESLIASGRRTALLGLGSIEQHGPHLPLGTDRWIADELLERLAARLDDAVAIPAIPLGCADEHLDFAGTLHIEKETLEGVLRDVLQSLARHGFERAFVFTAHGGNVQALDEMGERLAEGLPGFSLQIETDLRVGRMQSEVVADEALSPLAAGPHAGEYETSVVARIKPGTVRVDALEPGRMVEPGQAGGLFYPSLRPNTESGVLGDPSSARADRGDRYLDAWVDLLEGAYRMGGAPVADPGREKNRK